MNKIGRLLIFHYFWVDSSTKVKNIKNVKQANRATYQRLSKWISGLILIYSNFHSVLSAQIMKTKEVKLIV
jgi:hypothetical protein